MESLKKILNITIAKRMKQFFPLLEEKSFALQFLALVLIISVSLMLAMVVGIVLALPFVGIDLLVNFEKLTDLSNPENIVLLKYFQAVNQVGMFIIPVIIFAWMFNRLPLSYLSLNKKLNIPSLLFSLMAIMAFIPALNYLVILNEGMELPALFRGLEQWMEKTEEQGRVLTEAFLDVHTILGLSGNLLIIALLAAIGEEFLFRGVLLQLIFNKSKNIHLAVWISAILFSAMHMQFYGFLPRMILGVLFGYIFIWTSNLWIPIILHFVFNAISVVVAYLFSRNMIETDMESFGQTSNGWIIGISLLATVALLIPVWRNKSVYLSAKQN